MTDERYRELEPVDGPALTQEEVKEGWHFCAEFDYLLVGPGMIEQKYCLCDK